MKNVTGVVAALALFAAVAPPASADSVSCGPRVAAENIGSGDVVGRGATGREPDLDQTHADLPAAAKNRAGKGLDVTVPVYFHSITAGPLGALTDAQVADQIAVLNTTFGGGEGGAQTGFTFTLAGATRTDSAEWFFAKSGGNAEHDMKRTLKQGGDNALNVYANDGAGYLGYAYLPDITTKPGRTYLDGVVLNWRTLPGASTEYAGRYDLGETLAHETGHWLNLEHTFYGGCSSKGDYVPDTPKEKTPTSGCPAGKDTCTAPGDDPIHNYMDYSYDTCYTQFTEGQAQRMRDSWLLYRAG